MGALWIEVRRKLAHFVWAALLAVLYWMDLADWRTFAALLGISLIVIVGYQLSRHWRYPAFAIIFDLMERKKGKTAQLPGLSAFYYHLSFLLIVLVFPKEAAIAGMIVLAIGDTLALWWGVFLGQIPVPWNKKKDLDARIIAAIACTLVLLPVLPWWQGLIASLVGMFVESFDYKRGLILIDDNFLVPIASALAVYIIFLF